MNFNINPLLLLHQKTVDVFLPRMLQHDVSVTVYFDRKKPIELQKEDVLFPLHWKGSFAGSEREHKIEKVLICRQGQPFKNLIVSHTCLEAPMKPFQEYICFIFENENTFNEIVDGFSICILKAFTHEDITLMENKLISIKRTIGVMKQKIYTLSQHHDLEPLIIEYICEQSKYVKDITSFIRFLTIFNSEWRTKHNVIIKRTLEWFQKCDTDFFNKNRFQIDQMPTILSRMNKSCETIDLTVLDIMNLLYPGIICEYQFQGILHKLLDEDNSLPHAKPDIECHGNFFYKLEQRRKNGKKVHIVLKSLIENLDEALIPKLLAKCTWYQRENMNEVVEKIVAIFDGFSKKPMLTVTLWNTLSKENRGGYSDKLLDNICSTLEKQSSTFHPFCEETFCPVCRVVDLCCKADFASNMDIQTKLIKSLTNCTDDAFFHVLSFLKVKNALFVPADLPKNVHLWFSARNKKTLENIQPDFTDVCVLFNNLGKALDLLDVEKESVLFEKAEACLQRRKPVFYLNNCDLSQFTDKRGMDLFFTSLLSHFKDHLTPKDRESIEDSAIRKWFGGTKGARSDYHMKVIKAMLDISRLYPYSTKDEIISEISQWFLFWDPFFKQKNIEKECSHISSNQARECLLLFDDSLKKNDFSLFTLLEVFDETNCKRVCQLCDQVLGVNGDRRQMLEENIQLAKRIENGLSEMIDVLSKINSRKIFPTIMLNKELERLEELKKNVRTQGKGMSLNELRNSSYYRDTSKSCFHDLCILAKPLVNSKVFWNAFSMTEFEVYLEEVSCTCITLESILQYVCFEGKSNYIRRWDDILHRNTTVKIADVKNLFISEHVKEECVLFSNLTGRTVQPENIIRVFEYSEYFSNLQLLEKAMGALHLKCCGDTINSKIFIEFIDYREVPDEMLFADFQLKIKIIHDDMALNPSCLKLLENIGNNRDVMELLRSLFDDDLRNIIDAVENYTDQNLSVSTMSNLLRLHQFLLPLLRMDGSISIDDFIRNIEVLSEVKGIENIYDSIVDCKRNAHSLETFYRNIANRLETTKSKTSEILTSGEFEFSGQTGGCKLLVKTHNSKVLSEADISDLRSRALLISAKDAEEEIAEIQNFKSFIDHVDLAFEILDLYQELHESGHYKYISFCKKIKSQYLASKRKELTNDLDVWVSAIENYQKKYTEMRYLTFGHIRQVHLFLMDSKCWSEDSDKGKSNCFQSVEAIEFYLRTGERKRKLTFLDKYYNPQSPNEVLNAMVSVFEMEESNYERYCNAEQLANVYVTNLEKDSQYVIPCILSTTFEGNFPLPNTVLICDQDTQWDELHLFLLRCRTLSSQSLFFILVHIELLPTSLQYRLTEQVENCINDYSLFLHIIICGKDDQSFVHNFKHFIKPAMPLDQASIMSKLKDKLPDVKTVTSTNSGQGKSEFVHAECFSKNLWRKHLPISGYVKRGDFVKRVYELNLTDSDLLHIDIGVVDNPNELDTLLFQLTVLRYISSREYSFHTPTKNILIEIGNTFEDSLMKSLSFTMSLKRHHVAWEKFDNFVVSTHISSPVQVFCHYMKTMESEELNSKDLYFTGETALNPLPQGICLQILKSQDEIKNFKSYPLIEIYINVLADQLKKLSKSMFFRTETMTPLLYNHSKSLNIKRDLISSQMGMAKRIARRAFTSSFCSGGKSSMSMKNVHQFGEPLSWQSASHSFIVFNSQDMDTISVFSKDVKTLPDDINEFVRSQTEFGEQPLKHLDSMNQKELKDVLWTSIGSKNLSREDLDNIFSSYVITTDNLLKMVLISLKIDSKIPVVIMGETGCGKSTLLEYLSKVKNVNFEKINVHAGLSDRTIIEKIHDINKEALGKLKNKEEVWLFLDEINTSNCIGILTDALVHRHISGFFLSPNLVILAACNPYKTRDIQATITTGLQTDLKKDNLSNLVYRVHPLPETVLDYVWDFGMINSEDEKKYIVEMVRNLDLNSKNLSTFVNLLVLSQAFVKRNEESGRTASLREIHRCKILMHWFLNVYFKDIHPTSEKEERAIFLALLLGYESRFKTRKMRSMYWKSLCEESDDHELTKTRIQGIIKEEQKFIIKQLKVPAGVAKNRALRENVFALFICILNKLPICLIGKPGTSKSLSVNLLRSNMRGKNSDVDFFKSLPQLYFFSYQGSESSTSEGIIKVFNTAVEYHEKNVNDKVQVVVLLDEIGLAEKSRFQPLKVLHGLLEPGEMNELNISFVGMSNWAMDPAKMNRLIYISCPDMENDELLKTGYSIFCAVLGKNLENLNERDTTIVSHISEKYCCYTNQQEPEDFHCNRDFYNLLKFTSRKLKTFNDEFTEKDFFKILMKGVDRNFGGLRRNSGMKLAREVFFPSSDLLPSFNVCELIEENIEDKQGRHLMLFCSSDVILGKLTLILKCTDQKVTQIFGSQFTDDQFEDYSYRILSKIILCMEEGHVLILKDLNVVYGSLFDMLNQNYTTIGNKRHCRIALGPYSNPLCYVHENFKCIVIVNENILGLHNTALLSRFEKQIFSSCDMLENKFKDVLEELTDRLLKMREIFSEKENQSTLIPWLKLLPMYEEDILPSLIQKVADRKNNESPSVEECLKELLPLLQPEAMCLIKASTYSKLHNQEAMVIRQLYSDLPIHSGLRKYLEFTIPLVKQDEKTSTPLFDDVTAVSEKKSYEIDNQKCQLEKHSRLMAICTNSSIHTDISTLLPETKVVKLGTLKSEKHLDYELRNFWFKHDSSSILVIQCNDLNDLKHISLAKSRALFFRSQYIETARTEEPKHICFIMHLTRTLSSRPLFSEFNFQSDWSLVMLDTLTEPFFHYSDLFNEPVTKILNGCMEPVEQVISEQLLWAFSRIDYDDRQRSFDDVITVMNHFKKSKEIKRIIIKKISLWLELNVEQEKWAFEIAGDGLSLGTFMTFDNALRHSFSVLIRDPLANILYHLEENLSLDCIIEYSTALGDKAKNESDLWTRLFDKIITLKDVIKSAGPSCYHIFGRFTKMKIPFSKYFFDQIEKTREEFFEEIQKRNVKHELEEETEITDIPKHIIDEVVEWFTVKTETCLKQLIDSITPQMEELFVDDFFRYATLRRISILSDTDNAIVLKWTLKRLLHMNFDVKKDDGMENYRNGLTKKITKLYTALWLHNSVIIGVHNLLEMTTAEDIENESNEETNSNDAKCTQAQYARKSLTRSEESTSRNNDSIISTVTSNDYGSNEQNPQMNAQADKYLSLTIRERKSKNITFSQCTEEYGTPQNCDIENILDEADEIAEKCTNMYSQEEDEKIKSSDKDVEITNDIDNLGDVNIYLRCLVDAICTRMYPSEQSGRRLRAWQQKVNIFLAFAYDIGTASETQFKLRVIHDLICNVCIPYPETIERVLAAANDIKKIEFFFQNNAWQGVTDFVLALSTADIPRETQLKCLSQFAFRCITFDETNYQPCIVVIKAVFEKCHCEGELPLEPISIGAVLDECCFDINKRLLDKTIKALKFSSFVQEHCVLREILKVCESKKNIGPILLVADFIEHRLLSENSHLLNTDILLQSKEGSPILDELFDMRAALSNPDLDWTEELFIICFLRRFIFYSAKALTKDTEKERHLLKQLEKLFNFNNVKCQKQDNILKKLQIYLMRCISNGSSSYSIFQKVAGWRKSFETTLFPDLTEEKIKSSSDVYQPVAMNLAAFVRIKQEFQIEEKLTKSIFQHFINTELTGVVLYLYSHCYIGQIFSKQSGEETLLDVDVLPLAEIQKRILDCFILKKTYALDQIKIFKNCSSEALKHNSFISMILIWSAFLANKNNILLEAIEHPDFFESTMFCEFLQSRVYHCDTLSYIFSCENRHRVCALQCDSCPICFRGEVNRQFKNRQLQTKMTDKRKTVAYELIKLIFLGVHLSARALNHDINISDEENDDINDRLLCRINAQWSKVSSLLSLTENEVLRLCSLVFGKLQNEESLTSPDAFLNEIVEDSLKNRFLLLDKEWHDLDNHNSKVQLKSYKLSTFVETESQTSELILRRDFCPTLDNLLGEIELQNLEDKYPILYHILNRLYFLKLMRFLAPCLKWHRTIAVLGSFYLKKSDCRRMTVKTFLANEMGQNHSLRLGVRFCEFMKIWNELSSEKYCEALLAVNKELQAIANASEDEQLENFLIIDEHSPLLLTIEALVKIQNSFLDEIMDITCSGQCLATSFITKYVSKECIACFPIIPVLELQESDIIQSEFPHDCLIFSQRSLTTSRRVAFDFQKIEGETALYFLLEAKYIQLERQKLRILFKDDIAQSSVALLKKLLSVCPQSDAKDERIKKVLSVLASNQAEENYNFLTILGIAIAMIPKLPMIDPDTILLHFFQNRKNDFSFISFENAVPPEAKMGDLVMIYQWLEETNGTRVLENLDGEFKKEPPKDLENILIASRSKSLEWKSIVKGMKLFAQRRLSNKESLNLSQQLNSYMNDESFWPVTLVPTDRKKLCNLVPSDIKLKHIWVFYKCIEQHIKPRLQTSTHHEPRHMFDPNKRPQRKKKFRS